jgi:hypothetical protein
MGDSPYSPKKALAALLDDDSRKLFSDVKNEMTDVEGRLARREWRGVDTSYARGALYELDYWVSCTADVDAVKAARTHLRTALRRPDPPSALAQDAEGSFGTGTNLWFLKLDRSTDQILAREWPWPRKPMFLEQINDPIRMVTYLQDLCWSDIARCGRNNRKELNLALSVILRLVLKGGRAGYLSGPAFYPVLEQFVRDWQNPETGFFGVTYIIDGKGSQIRTNDLSLTFHVARYAPHLVRCWPKLIDTLLEMRTGTYPEGWLDSGTTMSDHNNYDVAELFHRGWIWMRPRQREAASAATADLLNWCLKHSVTADGNLLSPDQSDPIPDSFYYAASFLDTIGYFDKAKRFWSGNPLPGDPVKIRAGIIAQVKKFSAYYTEIDDTLVRLGAPEHPWTNAVL